MTLKLPFAKLLNWDLMFQGKRKMSSFDEDYFIDSRKVSSGVNVEDYDSSMMKASQDVSPQERLDLKEYVESQEEYLNESMPQKIKRLASAHVARAFEGRAGFFGDMQEFASELIGSDIFPEREVEMDKEKLGGFRFPSPEMLEGPNLSYKAPTSSQLREQSKASFGEYLEPKSENEVISQEMTHDLSQMLGGSFWQKLIPVVAGQTGKQTAKSLGASESTQNKIKAGAMIGATLFNIGNAPAVARNAINEAENMIAPGVTFSSVPTQNAFARLRNSDWFRSGRTTNKGPAMDMMAQIEPHIASGQIEGRMAMQLRHDLNTRRNFGLFENIDKRQANMYLDRVDQALRESMQIYGDNINPDWWRAYNQANQAYAATRRSQTISEFIHDNGSRKLFSNVSKAAFVPVVSGSLAAIPVITSAALGGAGLMKGIQVAHRIMRSPVLRRHYMNVVQQAAIQNVSGLKKAMESFDKAASKEER